MAQPFLATSGVAQNMICETLQLLYRGGHRHWAFEMALGLLERALGLRLLTGMVALRGLIECVAFLFHFLPMMVAWALVVALAIRATLHVTGLDLFV